MKTNCVNQLFFLALFVCSSTTMSLANQNFNETVLEQSNPVIKPEEIKASSQRWLVVLNDPRPQRLKGWGRVGRYSASIKYDKGLALQRLSKSILQDLPVNLVLAWPIKSIDVHCLVIDIPKRQQSKILQHFSDDKRVKWVQKYQTFEGMIESFATELTLESVSDNSSLKNQSPDPYFNLQSTFKQLNLQQVTAVFDGRGINLAMIDSGVDSQHPELKHALIEQLDFVDGVHHAIPAEHHGTGIAGVMIARKNNGVGIVGVSPAINLYAYRGCWEEESGKTFCNSLTLARALDRVAELKPTILNLSLTGPKDRLLESILAVIVSNGTQIIAAYDAKRKKDSRFPLTQPGVIFVQDSLESHSFGNTFDEVNSSIFRPNESDIVFAPGKEILTTQPGDTYAFMSGSSMATAHFASIMAIIAQAAPETELSDLITLIKRYTDPTDQHRHTDICSVLLALKVQINCQERVTRL